MYQPGMPQEPHVANLEFLCVFSHEMTNGLSKLQFTVVFCDVAPTSRRRREQNGWSHNFPHRYFLPFILVLGQNFLKLWHGEPAPKYSGFVPRPDYSISLIKSVITALTALHKVLKTLTVAELVKKNCSLFIQPTAMPKRVLKGKLNATRRIGRTRIRWLKDVIADLRRMWISGWMEKARNWDQWRRIIEEAKAHPGL